MLLIEDLPLFPLSDVVLLPEVSVPLYIFEPRYRQMTHEALEGDHQIGMIAVRPDGVSQMADNPPLFEIGCMGRIAHSQQRPDGTYQMLLMGEQRFRIVEEHPREGERLYRSAKVELLTDPAPNTPQEKQRLGELKESVLQLLARMLAQNEREESPEAVLDGFSALEPPRMINALTQSISFAPVERQQLLESDSILSRFETMDHLLRFRLAETGLAAGKSDPLPN